VDTVNTRGFSSDGLNNLKNIGGKSKDTAASIEAKKIQHMSMKENAQKQA
jgi:hypothetical protein